VIIWTTFFRGQHGSYCKQYDVTSKGIKFSEIVQNNGYDSIQGH